MYLAVVVPLSYGLPFVVLFFAVCERDFEFRYAPLVDEEHDGDNGLARLLDSLLQSSQFFFRKQEFTIASFDVIVASTEEILVDTHVLDPEFLLVEIAKRVNERSLSLSNGFDFRSEELQSGDEFLLKLVVERSPSVLYPYVVRVAFHGRLNHDGEKVFEDKENENGYQRDGGANTHGDGRAFLVGNAEHGRDAFPYDVESV